jgi:hypothetical protein
MIAYRAWSLTMKVGSARSCSGGIFPSALAAEFFWILVHLGDRRFESSLSISSGRFVLAVFGALAHLSKSRAASRKHNSPTARCALSLIDPGWPRKHRSVRQHETPKAAIQQNAEATSSGMVQSSLKAAADAHRGRASPRGQDFFVNEALLTG